MDKSSMFEQSRSLIAGAKIIIDSDGINDNGSVRIPTTPVILSCSFAIEICLKLLILQETGEEAKGHNIKTLFDELPDDILSKFNKHFLSQNKEETKNSLEANIVNHETMFVNWRYAYETTKPIECSPSFLYLLAFSLNVFIQKYYVFNRNDNGWVKTLCQRGE